MAPDRSGGLGKPDPPAVNSSMSRDVVARVGAQACSLALGVAAGVLTAHLLGPGGKGAYATIGFLGGVIAPVCAAGLGEAAVVRAGDGTASFREGLAAALPVTFTLSVVGMVTLAGASVAVLGSDSDGAAIAVACATIPMVVHGQVLTLIATGQRRIVAVSVLLTAGTALNTLCIWLLAGPLELGVAGALGGGLAQATATLAALLVIMRGTGTLSRPRWQPGYLSGALRYGALVQVSFFVLQLSGRFDLVLVYLLLSPEDAGVYSVALTMGGLASTIPFALAFVIFPRIAELSEAHADLLAVRTIRFGALISIPVMLALGATAWLTVPQLFGSAFARGAGPSVLLLAGGALVGIQLIIATTESARGRGSVIAVAFLGGLVVMVALDLVLVPSLELYGAALGSLASTVAGLAIAVRMLCAKRAVRPLDLLPRRDDLDEARRRLRALPVPGFRRRPPMSPANRPPPTAPPTGGS